MRWTFPACCAASIAGQHDAAAPAISDMNVRLFIR
jgi:hypothetical protein